MLDFKQRVSLSLPETVVKDVDRIAQRKGYDSRSAIISEMLRQAIDRDDAKDDSTVMMGNISLVYTTQKNNCQSQIARMQRHHIDEVISSLHVQLEDDHIMEVVLVQGRAHKLQTIADEMIRCKGVKSGKLTLCSVIIPPLYSREGV